MTPEQRDQVDRALRAFWTSRDEAAARQAANRQVDPGARAGVTAGGHLDHVAQLLAEVCLKAGAPLHEIYYKAPPDERVKDKRTKEQLEVGYTLAGYYRPTKQWDVVVYHKGVPIVVIELKS